MENTNLMTVDNVPNVEIAKKQWSAYQELCRGLLDKSDYQKIMVKEKDENGQYVSVEREFKKKTAWQKLARAFNVDTYIVEKEFSRSKTGRINEAYYCVRATLPNGRTVESDALCSRVEKGKSKVSDHTIIATAKTRATNRAISELIGAGEVSSDEMTDEYRAVDDPDHHYIDNSSVSQSVSNPVGNSISQSPKMEAPTIDVGSDNFVTAAEVGEPKPECSADNKKQDVPVTDTPKKKESSEFEIPKCIVKALQRIASKGVEITPETVYAHVNWRQISDEDKEAAKAYIDAMGGQ